MTASSLMDIGDCVILKKLRLCSSLFLLKVFLMKDFL